MSAIAVLRRGADVDVTASSSAAALVHALRGRGLELTVEDVTWLRGATPRVGLRGAFGAQISRGRALVRARAHGEPSDLYLAEARLSPEGALLEAGALWNISRTSSVDEGSPLVKGSLAATVTTTDGVATGLHVYDLSGVSPSSYAELTRTQRAQLGVANFQQTGEWNGVVHDAYVLDPVADTARASFRDDGTLAMTADERAIVIDPQKREVVEGSGWIRATLEAKAKPGNLITWTVDRVRAMPWFGEENMQWVKAVAFTGLDLVKRTRAEVLGDDSENDVKEAMSGLNAGAAAAPVFTDPESGWPPPPLEPLAKPLPGEGQWIALDRDPFVTQTPGNPAAFVTTFVRADKQRPQTRIYVTLWDPRQVSLHMEAGTVEPVSATGEAGSGVIPRTPEVLKNVVAGFNGGFQAMHGEFGMQANGILYLPPKPYAATVLELRDGTTAFGSWPNDPRVPDEVLSYRQNMTALIENEKWNPWGRTWWGGTPKGWADNIHTTRSGICLTREGFVGYFWGVDISAEVLATSMTMARCSYGMHLDMNPGLAGFEFYNVQPSASWASLGRPLQSDWEYEGSFKDLPEFRYRARRMIKGMQHQNFPQYIHRDARDFFFLTRRAILPGTDLPPEIAPPEAGEGAWRVKALPQHGFPYAIATTQLRPDPLQPSSRVRVLRVDPKTVKPSAPLEAHAPPKPGDPPPELDKSTIATFGTVTKPRPGEAAVWLSNNVFLISETAPAEGATPIAVGVEAKPSLAHAAARVAIGVQDEDGMLTWAEMAEGTPADEKSARTLDALLKKLGCSSRLLVRGDARVLLGGATDLAGVAATPIADPAAILIRDEAPGARRYFADNAIVGPSVWQPLQSQRVRYFRKPTKKGKAQEAAAPAPATDDPPPP